METKDRKKIGLALGSGGSRGFCHIGVLQVLEENNIPIDCIAGCSVGAIVGGCYCAGISLEDLVKVGVKLTNSKIMDFDILLKNQGIIKGNRIMSYLVSFLGDKTYEDCKIPFASTCVDARKGELITFTSGKLVETIRASMSIPAAFQSVSIGNLDSLIDGGVMERIPIKQARDLGADIVIAVDALGPPERNVEIKTPLDMIERFYSLLDWESSQYKIKEADILITPQQGPRTIRLFKNNEESIEFGRIAANKMLPEIIKKINE